MAEQKQLPYERTLGKTGIKVPAIGLGCMSMSPGIYGAPDPKECQLALERALEKNCTFWDTANVYGLGHNETFLSTILKTKRKEVFLCTKFGLTLGNGALTINGTPEHVKESCTKSLERLGVDYIDLYYLHRVDKNTPIEKTVGAMAELVKEGKIKYIGLSECSAETLRKAYAVHPITAVQVEYSPWTLDIETNGVLEACKELGVTVVAYSPLGRGFLTGAIKSPDDFEASDWRRNNPRFQGENFQTNLKIVHEFEKLAERKKCTPGQLCLAWVLAQGENFIAIPGTKRVKYLEENLGAKNVSLTNEELKEIREIISKVPVSGDRYADLSNVNI